MIFRLKITQSHKNFVAPVTAIVSLEGHSIHEVIDKLRKLNNAPPEHHLWNLLNYRRTAFKDPRGVKHSWKIEEIQEPRPA